MPESARSNELSSVDERVYDMLTFTTVSWKAGGLFFVKFGKEVVEFSGLSAQNWGFCDPVLIFSCLNRADIATNIWVILVCFYMAPLECHCSLTCKWFGGSRFEACQFVLLAYWAEFYLEWRALSCDNILSGWDQVEIQINHIWSINYDNFCSMCAREHCRISPPRLLAECCKRWEMKPSFDDA